MATHFTINRILLFAVVFGSSFSLDTPKELRTKETNQDGHIRLGYQIQRKSLDPSRVARLSWQPRVFLYRDFLSEEECDHLVSWVDGKRSYSASGVDSQKFGISMDIDDEITKVIEERISAWTFLPKENSKPLSVLNFSHEDSQQKYSYFGNKDEEQVDQPLLATVVLYLSNVSQGGQILFPESEDRMWSDCTQKNDILKPSKGNAIVFFNLHLNAGPDQTSSHARCPVLQGDMWCATKFFYMKQVNAGKDLARSDDADCTDEDDNCPQWAAIGECQRNSVFMIGSPDYYGTCRKSCDAC
ncbi:2-oxoglutarate (2OG) and Fe(II)-dependent oxygenase superfamily protein [Striga asiatica]|uniref:procollagen-proline 4-dioxygenase n=1 Tax=Striga asiatica TaxID=4170 RepID=A0A5A7P3I4_STRAF|nr:2-oxoglutarate (2OG) and Fe(II)-dependent oxygenase superfamily protein [Striga asiatica]